MILLFFAVWGRWHCQKKDKIDPWHLAMLGIGSVRPKKLNNKVLSFQLFYALCLYLVWLTENECG
jgi:hypothetical protein